MHWKLFQLLDNWFGQRFIRVADSNVVDRWFSNAIQFRTTLKSNFFQFVRLRFLFSTKNPGGYFMAFIFSYIIIAYEFLVTSIILSLAIGSYLIAISTTKDIKGILRFIQRQAQIDGKRFRFLKKIEQFILSQSSIKQLSECSYSFWIIDPMIICNFAFGNSF